MTSLVAADVPDELLSRSSPPACQLVFHGAALARTRPRRAIRRRPGPRARRRHWTPTGTRPDAGATTSSQAILTQTDVLLPNEEEARRLSGQPTLDGAITSLTGAGSEGRRQAWRSWRAVRRWPAIALDRVTAPSLGPVVDTTGAGDCFNAGLITGLLRGLDLPAAAGLGCAAGSASTRAAGGTAAAPDLATAVALSEAVTIEPGWQ